MEKDLNGDARLVEMAKNDPEKFGFLMERYQYPLFRYIKRLGRLSDEDAEDLLQEVFIKAYRKLNEYDERLKFSSWVYRIAHNVAVDYFRKAGARPRIDDLEDGDWEKIGTGLSMEKEITGRDCARHIRRCIGLLPMKYREVLILRFIEERGYEEIMDILRKPKGSVATLIARGREMLKEKLREENINCF